jgi:hypothetical protein
MSAAVMTDAEVPLPPGLLDEAAALRDGLQAVLSVRKIDSRDLGPVLGDPWVVAIRLVAASWRRSGRLSPGGQLPPINGVILSVKLTASVVDGDGRHHPSNAAALLGQVRRHHPDAVLTCGILSWTWGGGAHREYALPGDYITETLDGIFRAVRPEE